MIRFAWLQFRAQAAVVLSALLILAIGLAITGPHLVHLYNASVATCASRGDCGTAKALFVSNDVQLRGLLLIVVIITPALLGIFWGAPLIAHELETGTYRLVWTQHVSRTRWLAVKLLLVGLAAMVVALGVSLMVTWWASPFDIINANRFAPSTFDERGVVAAGYAAFAFVLGATAGALIRRTVPAMATTLVAFIAARLAFTSWIRPHLVTPAHLVLALNPATTGFGLSGPVFFVGGAGTLQPSAPDIPNAWVTSTRIVDNAGRGLTTQVLETDCPRLGQGGAGARPPLGSGRSVTQAPPAKQAALQSCVAKIGATYHELVSYQPANRYWTFQWYELAVFVGGAFLLSAFLFWWVRRRLA